jgi:hypothetical protein
MLLITFLLNDLSIEELPGANLIRISLNKNNF